ncbi:hypothetical protein AB0F72_32760 [Actinoplanes sp. NPDC023936]|uniref:hypothetical protein n=1 Tax=Actinoplanes sp. NPDC023936 TaxID=3154910 RepID=UPI0033EA247A
MDRFTGRCWLDWWANPSTNLFGAQISVVIVPAGSESGWTAHGRLAEEGADALEAFTFLHGIDPVFTLRFVDDSAIAVIVHAINDDGECTMTEYTGLEDRAFTSEIRL